MIVEVERVFREDHRRAWFLICKLGTGTRLWFEFVLSLGVFFLAGGW